MGGIAAIVENTFPVVDVQRIKGERDSENSHEKSSVVFFLSLFLRFSTVYTEFQ